MGHFLQSAAWKSYQESIGNKTFDLSGVGWHALVVESSGRGVKRLYSPYGPEVRDRAALKEALYALEKLGRQEKAVFLRVEPTGAGVEGKFVPEVRNLLGRLGYKATKHIQPSDTWVIDLTQDEAALLKQMGSTNRNSYRGIERRGMEITTSTDPKDIKYLSNILGEIASRKGDFHPHDGEYLCRQADSLFANNAARLYLVHFDGDVIAASLAYEHDGVIYYAHSGSDSEHRKLRAGSALVAYMLFDAKNRGFSSFDLFGIAPEDDPDHPWAGFTSFKKSFGGSVRHYPGTWDRPLKPAMYALYQAALRTYGRMRRSKGQVTSK